MMSAGLGESRPAHIAASIARIVRAHAKSTTAFRLVFGSGTAADEALRSRVTAIREADTFTIAGRAERLHSLAVWLSATAEALECESTAAAALRVELGTIIAESESLAELRPAHVAA
jgi:hypothetical protein